MFESVLNEIKSVLKHIDIGLDISYNYPYYYVLLTTAYLLFFASVYLAVDSILVYTSLGVLMLVKILIFSTFSVQFYAREIENRTINPLQKISNWSDILLTGSFVNISIILGLMLLILPGIYFGYRLSYAVPLVTIQHLSPKQAIKQSWEQTDGDIIEIVSIGILGTTIYTFLIVALLSTYLINYQFPIIGKILAILVIIHATVFELGLLGGIVHLQLYEKD